MITTASATYTHTYAATGAYTITLEAVSGNIALGQFVGDAKACAQYYASTYAGASADFYVGHTGDIWQGNDYFSGYS